VLGAFGEAEAALVRAANANGNLVKVLNQGHKIDASVDLPLGNESMRVLAHFAEEAGSLVYELREGPKDSQRTQDADPYPVCEVSPNDTAEVEQVKNPDDRITHDCQEVTAPDVFRS